MSSNQRLLGSQSSRRHPLLVETTDQQYLERKIHRAQPLCLFAPNQPGIRLLLGCLDCKRHARPACLPSPSAFLQWPDCCLLERCWTGSPGVSSQSPPPHTPSPQAVPPPRFCLHRTVHAQPPRCSTTGPLPQPKSRSLSGHTARLLRWGILQRLPCVPISTSILGRIFPF